MSTKDSHSIYLRILTEKSLLGFGDSAYLKVEEVLKLGDLDTLISAYYNLSKITFTNEVLNKIGINESQRITKPGVDRELGDVVIAEFVKNKIQNNLNEKSKKKATYTKRYKKKNKSQYAKLGVSGCKTSRLFVSF